MEPFLFFAGVAGTAAALGAWLVRRARKRTEAIAGFAKERGFQFRGKLEGNLSGVPAFRLLDQGRTRTFNNLIEGTKDRAAVLFADYSYVVGSGKSRSRQLQSVFVVHLPGLGLPRFFLRPQRSVLDAIGKALGGKDLDFDDDPDFSRKFVLQTEWDERAVRLRFTPAVRSFFTELPEPPSQLECWGDHVLWNTGVELALEALEPCWVSVANLLRVLAYERRDA